MSTRIPARPIGGPIAPRVLQNSQGFGNRPVPGAESVQPEFSNKCAHNSARHINPWSYVWDLLTILPARPPDADLYDLLPDAWAAARAGPRFPS